MKLDQTHNKNKNNILYLIKKNVPALFVFYLIISGNYAGELFNCGLVKQLTQNIYIKHIVGFLTLYFFVILVNEDNLMKGDDMEAPFKELLTTLLLYIWFIMTTRCPVRYLIPVMILLMSIYLVEMISIRYYKNSDRKNEWFSLEMKEKFMEIVVVLAAIITFCGTIVYLGEKKMEYGNKWSWRKFFMGRYNRSTGTYCRFETPKKISKIHDLKNFINGFSLSTKRPRNVSAPF